MLIKSASFKKKIESLIPISCNYLAEKSLNPVSHTSKNSLFLETFKEKKQYRLSSAVKIFDLEPTENFTAASETPFVRMRP
jgi:hypothetical protein